MLSITNKQNMKNFFKLFTKTKQAVEDIPTKIIKNKKLNMSFWYNKINECLAKKHNVLHACERNILQQSFNEEKILRIVKDILFEYDIITKELYLSSLTGSQPDFTARQLIKEKNV